MSLPEFPEPPLAAGEIGTGTTRLRFEDVAQDGRLRLEGVWPPFGPILWGKMQAADALLRVAASGVRAVLTYVRLEAEDEPVSVRAPAEHEVRWRVGHTRDALGATNRLVFDSWLESWAPRGVPNNPGLGPIGGRVRIARAFGQNVFTKPTAQPGEHRVLHLDEPRFGRGFDEPVAWFDPGSLAALPAGVELLEPEPRPDIAPTVFGLCHTDGNQHVNFLAYPRLAEEAALRRFRALGIDVKKLARRAEIGYRKPCFAGDGVRVVLQAYRDGEVLGAVAAFLPEAEAGRDFHDWPSVGRPHCVTRLEFS